MPSAVPSATRGWVRRPELTAVFVIARSEGDAPQEVPLGDAPQEVPLGDEAILWNRDKFHKRDEIAYAKFIPGGGRAMTAASDKCLIL